MYFRRTLKTFLPHKPGVCRSRTSSAGEVAVDGTLQSRMLYPYPSWRIFLEHRCSTLSFKERELEEHRHLVSFRNDTHGFLQKLLGKGVWRIGDDVAVPPGVVRGEEISHLPRIPYRQYHGSQPRIRLSLIPVPCDPLRSSALR